MLTQQAALDLVKRFSADLRAANVPVDRVILFGSYARGEQHEWSDIDVALVGQSFYGAMAVDADVLTPFLRHYIDIEPHTFPTAYFEEGDPFIEEIKRTGIVVV